jgi:hypothetical protein
MGLSLPYNTDVRGKSSIVLIFVMGLAIGQAPQGGPLPKFEDFKVAEIFTGKPAAPIIATPRQRLYRTMIREGTRKGPSFAGHYTIAGWGCGSSCSGFAIVDAVSGQVFDTPFEYYAWGGLLLNKDYGPYLEDISFHKNSRLLIIRGCPDEKNCGTYYYEWTGSQLKLLTRIPTVPVPR